MFYTYGISIPHSHYIPLSIHRESILSNLLRQIQFVYGKSRIGVSVQIKEFVNIDDMVAFVSSYPNGIFVCI